MTLQSQRGSPFSRFVRLRWISGIVVGAICAVVLTGWAIHSPTMQSFFPGWVTMKVNTALGLSALAAAVMLHNGTGPSMRWRGPSARVLAACTVTLGAATLGEYLFHVDLGVDQLFVTVPPDRLELMPGRMAAVTALIFLLLGSSLVSIGAPLRFRPAQGMALFAGAIALTAMLGQLYGTIDVVGQGHGIQIAPHTALAFALLAASALTLESDVGWLPTILSPGSGGRLARRLLPFSLAVPLGLGMFRHLGAALGFTAATSDDTFVAVATMLTFTFIIWHTARALNDADVQWQLAEHQRVEATVRAETARESAAADRAARRLAETAMREREDALSLFDHVIDSAPTGIAIFDLEMRFVRVNSTLAEINGAPNEAHAGRTMQEMMPDFAPAIEGALRQVSVAGTRVGSADVMTDGGPDAGGRRYWQFTAYPVCSTEDKLIALGLNIADVSDQRRLEVQLAQSQRVEAVGQLAAGVAHDFNNILTVITGYCGMLLADPSTNRAARADVGEINKAADRAAGLTRQLLAFGRQQMLDARYIRPNEIVGDLDRMLRRLIPANISLSTRLDPTLDGVVADAGQLEQVLVNLVVNARDAISECGHIEVETSNVDLDEHVMPLDSGITSGRYVRIAVSDNGAGMDDAVRARVFEPFFTTKDVGKGTGLGLATVYGIIKQTGGHITVTSEPGHGTTFTIYLPAATDVGDRAEASVAPPAPGKADSGPFDEAERRVTTVLLAEDESAVRATARRILEAAGYVVVEAVNGVEALAVFRRRADEIDVVVTDVIMPEMGGIELAATLRDWLPDVKVLFMSGYTDTMSPHEHLDADRALFIQKPFTPEELMTKVSDVLGRASAPHPSARAPA